MAGVITGIVVFTVWYLLINVVNMDVSIARGYIMALMVFIQNIHVFNCRSEKSSAFKVPIKGHKLIAIGVIVSIVLQIIVMEVEFLAEILNTHRVPNADLFKLVLLALPIVLLMEIFKFIRRKKECNN